MRSRAQASGQRRAVGVTGAQQEGRAGGRRLVRRSDRTLRDMPEINGYDSDELMCPWYPVTGNHDWGNNEDCGDAGNWTAQILYS